MPKETLIIGDKFELPDGSVVIGLNTPKQDLRMDWRRMTMETLKAPFVGQEISIRGKDYQFQTKVLGVEILNSIADFKNVFLKIEKVTEASRIQQGDEVEVDI